MACCGCKLHQRFEWLEMAGAQQLLITRVDCVAPQQARTAFLPRFVVASALHDASRLPCRTTHLPQTQP